MEGASVPVQTGSEGNACGRFEVNRCLPFQQAGPRAMRGDSGIRNHIHVADAGGDDGVVAFERVSQAGADFLPGKWGILFRSRIRHDNDELLKLCCRFRLVRNPRLMRHGGWATIL